MASLGRSADTVAELQGRMETGGGRLAAGGARLAAGDCRSLPRSVADGELYVGNAELFTYGEHLGDMLKTALGVGMNGHL